MKYVRQILVIINLKTIVITALAVLSTWLCRHCGISAEFPTTLIAINAEKFVERLELR